MVLPDVQNLSSRRGRDGGVAGTMSLRGRRGPAFTLVELMVVIALIGVMTAMILPEMRGTYSDAVLRAGSRDLISVCSIAASRAISFNRPHRVRIEPGTRAFRIERQAGRNAGTPAFVPVREVPGCEGRLDERIDVRVVGRGGAGAPTDGGGELSAGTASTQPVSEVGFYPDGTADAVEILLRDREGFRVTLRVNPITGRIVVVPNPPAEGAP